MRNEARLNGTRHRANELGTMLQIGDADDLRYLVVAGDAGEALRTESRRVRLGRAWIAIPRAAVAIFGGLVVLGFLDLLESTIVPVLDTWLGPLSFIGGAFLTIPAVLVGASSAYGVTGGWTQRWTPNFDGIEVDAWPGTHLFKDLTTADRDRLLATSDAGRDVQRAALEMLEEAYRAEDRRKAEAEKRATDEVPSRSRAEAMRLMGIAEHTPQPIASTGQRMRRAFRLRRH